MNSATPTADAPVLLPAETEMITGEVAIGSAVALARRGMERGRIVQVCAYCIPAAMQQALGRFRNVSHGICRPCLVAETKGAVS